MLAEFSIVPMDKGDKNMSLHVAEMVKIVRHSGLDYELTAMGTLVEGDADMVFELIRRCHRAMKERSSRVLTTVRIDDQEGATGRLKGKVRSVMEKLAQPQHPVSPDK